MMMTIMDTQFMEGLSVLIYQLGMYSVARNSFQKIYKGWHYYQWNRSTQPQWKNGKMTMIPYESHIGRIQIMKRWVFHFQKPVQWQLCISILDLLSIVFLLLLFLLLLLSFSLKHYLSAPSLATFQQEVNI